MIVVEAPSVRGGEGRGPWKIAMTPAIHYSRIVPDEPCIVLCVSARKRRSSQNGPSLRLPDLRGRAHASSSTT